MEKETKATLYLTGISAIAITGSIITLIKAPAVFGIGLLFVVIIGFLSALFEFIGLMIEDMDYSKKEKLFKFFRIK